MRPLLVTFVCRLILAAFCAALPACVATAQVSPPRPDIPPAEEPTPAPPPPTPMVEPPRGPGEADEAAPVPADEPTLTAGGALRKFMASRDYRTIRELKSVMTPRLVSRYDQDSVPFNGKRGIRLAAFDFTEQDLKPVPIKPAKAAAGGGGSTAQAAVAPPPEAAYVATVRSLWEEQGEAVEMRVESLRIAQQENGLWRVGSLEKVRSEPLRFKDPIAGVTSLRMLMRAWHRRDLQAARPLMSQPFLKKYDGREEALREIIVGRGGTRHTAYQILEVVQQGETTEIARVKLFETVPGQPGPMDGPVRTVKLVKAGPRWLLGAWE